MPWREQFEKSLLDYVLANKDETRLLSVASVDEHIDRFQIDRSSDTPAVALRALAVLAFTYAYQEFEEVMEQCESPIEMAMLLALTLAGRDRLAALGNVYFGGAGRPVEADDYEYLTIEPQATLGEYRVDFLVTLSSLDPVDRQNVPEHVRARAERRRGWTDRKLVVECDGHDFHDRTREQASRDRARDRMLQSIGFPVFRYTGSDIWRDVMGCAAQVLDALATEMRRASE